MFMNNAFFRKPTRLAWALFLLVIGGLLAIGGATGYWWKQQLAKPAVENNVSVANNAAVENKTSQRRVLYWYDPMTPQQHFDKPGKSPFMDMALVPRYAEESATENAADKSGDTADSSGTLRIDPAITQKLGMRTAKVIRSALPVRIDALGNLRYNARDVAVVQLRASAFVEKVWPHAMGDIVQKGAPLVELLVPDWAVLQREYVALRARGNTTLLKAARERLQIAGMPEAAIERLERSGEVQARVTITAPLSGVMSAWDVRSGMTLERGAMLTRINGLSTLWLDIAIPEVQAALLQIGAPVLAELTALPGAKVRGLITQRLPALDDTTLTARFRVELTNEKNKLLSGMTARVHIDVPASTAQLHVPRDAVIRTGTHTLVMVAESGGRFRPVEVATGADIADRTIITAGLAEGDDVVISGQFLIDSEASLSGVIARRLMREDAVGRENAAGHENAAGDTP